MVKHLHLILALAALAVVAAAAVSLATTEVYNDISIYREEAVSISELPAGQQKTTTTRAWIKGQKMRNEAGGGEVTILRPDLDKVWNINLLHKTYLELPMSEYRRAARMSLAMLGVDPTYSWTGREKKIGAWKCREAIISDETNPGGDRLKTIWWVSEDAGLDKRLMRHVMSIGAGSDMDPATARFFEKMAGIPGYPVQTETSFTHGATTLKTVNTLQKMERRDIKDSQFELPEGFTRMMMQSPYGAQ